MKKIILMSLAVLSIAACKKKSDDDDSSSSNNNPPANAVAYWYCKLDGTAKNFSIVTGAEDCEVAYSNSASISTQGDTSTFIYGGSIGLASNNYPYFAINRGTLILPTGGTPDDIQEMTFWQNTVVAYSPEAANGVEIVYFDANGDEWNTSNGSQASSTFTFTNITTSTDFGLHADFKATFKCTLYNSGGQKKELTGGQAFIGFGTQN